MHRDPAQSLLPGQNHLLDPLLLLPGARGVGAEGESHDEQDGEPGDHRVEQHQRHAERHPGGVAQRVLGAVVIIEGAQDNEIGGSSW